MKNIYAGSVLVFLCIFFDQVSKHLIRQSGGFYICNKGIAFGIQISDFIFLITWLAIFGGIVWYAIKNKSKIYPLSLVIAGALSNMIDRIHLGCVIDFIDIKIFNYPLFNLADTFIVIGAIMIVVKSINQKSKINK